MKKIICWLLGHRLIIKYSSGSLVIYCKRCGKLDDFTVFAIKINP